MTIVVTRCDDGDFHNWIYTGDITEEIVFRRCEDCGLCEKTTVTKWSPQ